MRTIVQLIAVAVLLMATGCGSGAPDSFMQTSTARWEFMNIRPDLNYDDAWERVIYIVSKRFEPEMISKENGYIRSEFGPSFVSTDAANDKYQIRITAKFTPDKRRLDFKIESRIFDGKLWNNGSDMRVAAIIRGEFRNAIGEPLKQQPAAPANSLKQQ